VLSVKSVLKDKCGHGCMKNLNFKTAVRELKNEKSLHVNLINDVIFSIIEERSARHNFCVNMISVTFSFVYSAFFYLGGSSIPT
jgi:hypothetical protein